MQAQSVLARHAMLEEAKVLGAAPILRIALTSTVLTQTELYQLAKDKLKTRIEATGGVAQVDISGGRERQIKVNVDNDKLRSYNLSITQVQQVLAGANLDFPTGKISQPDRMKTRRLRRAERTQPRVSARASARFRGARAD